MLRVDQEIAAGLSRRPRPGLSRPPSRRLRRRTSSWSRTTQGNLDDRHHVGGPRRGAASGDPGPGRPERRDYGRYRGAAMVTPNRKELEAVSGETARDLVAVAALGERLREELGADALLVKLSDEGMLLLEKGRAPHRIRARAREVFDVTGAGDTVLAASPGAGRRPRPSHRRRGRESRGRLRCKRASDGTRPLADLLEGLSRPPRRSSSAAPTSRPSARPFGGHTAGSSSRTAASTCSTRDTSLLSEARKLGDFLVVGLNSDASVRTLKGPGRPILSEHDRAQVLGGLDAVDFVVLFEEETPERLIEALRPDVLVKGGTTPRRRSSARPS